MIIEQTLHGYDKGHGLLASSILMPPSDDTTKMSILSDWTGYKSANPSENFYMTGYPLADGNKYALAKSWYASEMERPGCVWTQTFIIDLENLDRNFDFRLLYDYFKRPTKGEYSFYSQSLDINFDKRGDSRDVLDKFDRLSILFLYSYLLSDNIGVDILIEKNQDDYIQLCLLFLQYLSVGILKRTSFSTGAEFHRRLDEKNFSIQFVTNGKYMTLSQSPWQGNITEDQFNRGIRYIVDEMRDPNDELPSLIKLFSKDIEDSKDKFIAMINLLYNLDNVIQNNECEVKYNEIVSIITNNFPTVTEGRLIKENFYSKRISSLFCSEIEALTILGSLPSDNSFDEDESNYNERMIEMQENDSDKFIELFKNLANIPHPNKFAINTIMYGIDHIEMNVLNVIIDEHWDNLCPYVGIKDSYFKNGYWLHLRDDHFKDMLLLFMKKDYHDFDQWNILLEKILKSEALVDENLSHALVENSDNSVNKIMTATNDQEMHFVCSFLPKECMKHLDKVLNWLDCQSTLSNRIEMLLIHFVKPNTSVVRRHPSSTWRSLVDADKGTNSWDYYVFMFRLSFNWYDTYTTFYLQHSFQKIYDALKSQSLPEKYWNMIKPFTSDVYFWEEWDKCKKLRIGVVRYLKHHTNDKCNIDKISTDNTLIKEMKKIWDRLK